MSRVAALVAVCGTAGAAMAQPILSFGFNEMHASYNTGTFAFVAAGVASTHGSVVRHLAPPGTAAYGPGSATGLVTLALTVSGIVPNTSATGTGTLTILDADDDSLTAGVAGTFTFSPPLTVFFTGSLTNVLLNEGGNSDGTFNGPSGGSFPLTPWPAGAFGSIVELHFDAAFFSQSYAGVTAKMNGQVIPTPGPVVLLAATGLLALRRRRS